MLRNEKVLCNGKASSLLTMWCHGNKKEGCKPSPRKEVRRNRGLIKKDQTQDHCDQNYSFWPFPASENAGFLGCLVIQ